MMMINIAEQKEKVAAATKNIFYKEVIDGLTASPKYLLSKYFYDDDGDVIFQNIMNCDEYYLTKCELEILQQQSQQIVQALHEYNNEFDVIELGAGDATKTFYLLKELQKANTTFTYCPIDISSNIIHSLEEELPKRLPGLDIHGLNGEYLDMIKQAGKLSSRLKVVLFMGANIGNMNKQQALVFCRQLRKHIQPGNLLIVGFDLKKNPQTILEAYNDKKGFTKEFNLNLLKRINRVLDANFNLSNFIHYPTYDPASGACKSYLVSTQQQTVHIGVTRVFFDKHEPVFMEISQKYAPGEIEYLASSAGFKTLHHFYDARQWFVDTVWQSV